MVTKLHNVDATFEKDYIRTEMLALEEKCRGQSGFLCEGQAFFVESVLWIVYDFKAWSEGTVRDIISIHNPEDPTGALEEQLVRAIGAQLLDPLEYLHGQVGRIFRDLRCKNLMVTSDGRVQLQIFTLPSILQEKAPIYKDSLLWASPELLLQERVPGASMTSTAALNSLSASVGPPVDVWALGMTLLELALGDPPFSPDLSPSQIFQAIVEGDSPALPAETSHLWSKGFKEVLASCLTKDASLRATIADLKAHPFFSGAPGPEFIVEHLLAPLPPIESRWKLISHIRETQEIASKERHASLLAQQQLQISSQLQSLHIPSGASSAIGTPQMSSLHNHSSPSSQPTNPSLSSQSTASQQSSQLSASQQQIIAAAASANGTSSSAPIPANNSNTNPLTSPLQSPPHTSMLSSASQPPMGEHHRAGDYLPSSPTHSAPQFSLSSPDMPPFDTQTGGPSINMGGVGGGPSLNLNGIANGPSLTSNGPSISSNNDGITSANGTGSQGELGPSLSISLTSSANGSVVTSTVVTTPRSSAQTPTPGMSGASSTAGGALSSSAASGGGAGPIDNPFLFDPSNMYAKQGSGASTPVQGQGTPRERSSQPNASSGALANGNGMVNSASASSVANGANGAAAEPTRGRFRIVNPAGPATASTGPIEMNGSAPSSSSSTASNNNAAYHETPHFQLPPMPAPGTGSTSSGAPYQGQQQQSPLPVYAYGSSSGSYQPHMRRNSKGSHMMGSAGSYGVSSHHRSAGAGISTGNSSALLDVNGGVVAGGSGAAVGVGLHHASLSPALPLQTPASNVPIESFLGENERDYFVVFRAIPGTMVSVALEGRTLVISGQIPPLPVSVLKFIQTIDRPASKFERRIPFPGDIDSTDVGKEIFRDSNLMVIRVKKCPKSIHIGDDMF